MVQILMVLALAGAAILSGVAGGVCVALVPMLLALPDDRRVPTQHLLARRRDRVSPLVLVLTVLADATLSLAAHPLGVRIGFALAAVLGLAALVLSLVVELPAGRAVPVAVLEDSGVSARAPTRDALRAANLAWSLLVVAMLVASFAALVTDGL